MLTSCRSIPLCIEAGGWWLLLSSIILQFIFETGLSLEPGPQCFD